MSASSSPDLKYAKPEPRWKAKRALAAIEAKLQRDCYLAVDRRDGPRCRVCKAHVGGLGTLKARHHHHLIYRSKGGAHEQQSVLSLCVACHDAIHRLAVLRLTGDANLRSPHTGALCGVKIERVTESGWCVTGMC